MTLSPSASKDLKSNIAPQDDIISRYPFDPHLIEHYGIELCLAMRALPWRRVGDTVIWASPRETNFGELTGDLNPKTKHRRIPVSTGWFDNMLRSQAGHILLARAHNQCPPKYALRAANINDSRILIIGAICLFAALAIWQPQMAILGILSTMLVVIASVSFVRLVAIIVHFKGHSKTTPTVGFNSGALPKISLLVPLYKEPAIVDNLLHNLMALAYPPAKLDIKIVLEADDVATIEALGKITLPAHITSIRVPPDSLRTKPKALNYALNFCEGALIGIYDAEDAPDPYQLHHVVDAFAQSDDRTAAVQCQLEFHNIRRNLLTRVFAIEYRVWFHMILPAFEYLRFPVPLGGTSVFIRADILREVGAWDAHNVTEDADLGVRLARFGYKTAVVDVATLETPNGTPVAWIRQRSRWLKGYVASWFSHMRNPIQLYRDLGLRGFIGVQILFLGGMGSYLAIPVFWLVWAAFFGFDAIGLATLPNGFMVAFSLAMFGAMTVSLACSLIALSPKKYRHLMPWVFAMAFYWPLGVMAAYKAVFELLTRPFYWDKTRHDQGAPIAAFKPD